MIVEPDFLNHWKTRTFVAAVMGYCKTQWKPTENPNVTQWETQPFPTDGPVGILLRLWAHCQQRKASRFDKMTPLTLAAICEWQGDPEWLMETLEEVGFVDREGSQVVAHDWDEANAKLVRNWRNGMKGGRPKNEPKNPKETQAKPKRNREEKRREEKSTPLPPSEGGDAGSSSREGEDSDGREPEAKTPPPGEDLPFRMENDAAPAGGLPSRAELKKASRAEKKRKRVERMLPMMRDLGGLIPGRSGERAWTWEEYEALLDLSPLDPEDVAVVAEYYRADLPGEKDFRRRDLLTLLNNWNGDVPKCRQRIKELGASAGGGPQGLKVHVIGG